MSCEEFCGEIEEYLDGALAPDEKKRFEEHMSSCPECRAEVDFARACAAAVGEMDEIDVPEDFLGGVHERIRAEKQKRQRYFGFVRRMGAVAACAVIAVAAYSGFDAAQFEKNGGELVSEEMMRGAVVNEEIPQAEEETDIAPVAAEETAAPKTEQKQTSKPKSSGTKAKQEVQKAETAEPEETAFAAAQVQTEDVAEVEAVSADTEEDTPAVMSLTDEAPAAAGGVSMARSVPSITVLYVDAEAYERVCAAADELFPEGYFADKEKFAEFLARLDLEGISYTVSGQIGDGETEFIISEN